MLAPVPTPVAPAPVLDHPERVVEACRRAAAGLDCDADHLYWWGDRRVWIPSVTQLLERVGYYDSSYYTDGAAERGSEGHRLIAEGVPVELWPAELQGYGAAWERWTDEVGWVTTAHELSLRGPAAYRDGKPLRGGAPLWCGTDDLVGVARRLGGAWTIDIKFGLPADWHCIQLAGYLAAMIAVDCAAAGLRTANLYLRPDGDADFVPHEDPAGDIGEWWSVVRRVRRKRGRMYWTPWRSLVPAGDARWPYEPAVPSPADSDPWSALLPVEECRSYGERPGLREALEQAREKALLAIAFETNPSGGRLYPTVSVQAAAVGQRRR